MRATIPIVMQVLVAVVLMEGAIGILSPVVGLQLAARDVTPELIGLVGSAYFGGFLAGTVTCHRVIDRVGHIRAFGVFAVLAANLTVLHVLVSHAYAWFTFRIVTGYVIAGLFVIVESWLNDKATSDNRGRIFSLYMTVSWAAAGVSPLAINLGDAKGTSLFLLAAILMSSAMIPMALTTVGNPEIGHRTHFGVRRLFGISPSGVTACFASGLINTSLYALFPVYIEANGFSAGEMAIVYSVSTIAGLVMQFPIGHLSDRFGRRPLILAVAATGAVVAIALALVGARSFWHLLVLFFLLEAILAPLYALGVGQTNDYITKREFVAASAGLLFAWGLGATIGPAVVGFVVRPLGTSGIFYFAALSLVLLGAFISIRMLLRRAKTAEEQGNYVAVPQSLGSYGAPELDPRGEPEEPLGPERSVEVA